MAEAEQSQSTLWAQFLLRNSSVLLNTLVERSDCSNVPMYLCTSVHQCACAPCAPVCLSQCAVCFVPVPVIQTVVAGGHTCLTCTWTCQLAGRKRAAEMMRTCSKMSQQFFTSLMKIFMVVSSSFSKVCDKWRIKLFFEIPLYIQPILFSIDSSTSVTQWLWCN